MTDSTTPSQVQTIADLEADPKVMQMVQQIQQAAAGLVVKPFIDPNTISQEAMNAAVVQPSVYKDIPVPAPFTAPVPGVAQVVTNPYTPAYETNLVNNVLNTLKQQAEAAAKAKADADAKAQAAQQAAQQKAQSQPSNSTTGQTYSGSLYSGSANGQKFTNQQQFNAATNPPKPTTTPTTPITHAPGSGSTINGVPVTPPTTSAPSGQTVSGSLYSNPSQNPINQQAVNTSTSSAPKSSTVNGVTTTPVSQATPATTYNYYDVDTSIDKMYNDAVAAGATNLTKPTGYPYGTSVRDSTQSSSIIDAFKATISAHLPTTTTTTWTIDKQAHDTWLNAGGAASGFPEPGSFGSFATSAEATARYNQYVDSLSKPQTVNGISITATNEYGMTKDLWDKYETYIAGVQANNVTSVAQGFKPSPVPSPAWYLWSIAESNSPATAGAEPPYGTAATETWTPSGGSTQTAKTVDPQKTAGWMFASEMNDSDKQTLENMLNNGQSLTEYDYRIQYGLDTTTIPGTYESVWNEGGHSVNTGGITSGAIKLAQQGVQVRNPDGSVGTAKVVSGSTPVSVAPISVKQAAQTVVNNLNTQVNNIEEKSTGTQIPTPTASNTAAAGSLPNYMPVAQRENATVIDNTVAGVYVNQYGQVVSNSDVEIGGSVSGSSVPVIVTAPNAPISSKVLTPAQVQATHTTTPATITNDQIQAAARQAIANATTNYETQNPLLDQNGVAIPYYQPESPDSVPLNLEVPVSPADYLKITGNTPPPQQPVYITVTPNESTTAAAVNNTNLIDKQTSTEDLNKILNDIKITAPTTITAPMVDDIKTKIQQLTPQQIPQTNGLNDLSTKYNGILAPVIQGYNYAEGLKDIFIPALENSPANFVKGVANEVTSSPVYQDLSKDLGLVTSSPIYQATKNVINSIPTTYSNVNNVIGNDLDNIKNSVAQYIPPSVTNTVSPILSPIINKAQSTNTQFNTDVNNIVSQAIKTVTGVPSAISKTYNDINTNIGKGINNLDTTLSPIITKYAPSQAAVNAALQQAADDYANSLPTALGKDAPQLVKALGIQNTPAGNDIVGLGDLTYDVGSAITHGIANDTGALYGMLQEKPLTTAGEVGGLLGLAAVTGGASEALGALGGAAVVNAAPIVGALTDSIPILGDIGDGVLGTKLMGYTATFGRYIPSIADTTVNAIFGGSAVSATMQGIKSGGLTGGVEKLAQYAGLGIAAEPLGEYGYDIVDNSDFVNNAKANIESAGGELELPGVVKTAINTYFGNIPVSPKKVTGLVDSGIESSGPLTSEEIKNLDANIGVNSDTVDLTKDSIDLTKNEVVDNANRQIINPAGVIQSTQGSPILVPTTQPITIPQVDISKTNTTPTIDISKIPSVDISKTPSVDISKINVPSVDISKTNIPQVDISKTNISPVDISKNNISQVDISKDNIPQVDLSKINTPQVDISKISVPQVDISKVNVNEDIKPSTLPEYQKTNIPTIEDVKEFLKDTNIPENTKDNLLDEYPKTNLPISDDEYIKNVTDNLPEYPKFSNPVEEYPKTNVDEYIKDITSEYPKISNPVDEYPKTNVDEYIKDITSEYPKISNPVEEYPKTDVNEYPKTDVNEYPKTNFDEYIKDVINSPIEEYTKDIPSVDEYSKKLPTPTMDDIREIINHIDDNTPYNNPPNDNIPNNPPDEPPEEPPEDVKEPPKDDEDEDDKKKIKISNSDTPIKRFKKKSQDEEEGIWKSYTQNADFNDLMYGRQPTAGLSMVGAAKGLVIPSLFGDNNKKEQIPLNSQKDQVTLKNNQKSQVQLNNNQKSQTLLNNNQKSQIQFNNQRSQLNNNKNSVPFNTTKSQTLLNDKNSQVPLNNNQNTKIPLINNKSKVPLNNNQNTKISLSNNKNNQASAKSSQTVQVSLSSQKNQVPIKSGQKPNTSIKSSSSKNMSYPGKPTTQPKKQSTNSFFKPRSSTKKIFR